MTRSRLYSVLGIFIIGGLAGLIVAGATASFVQYSNSLEFCISCHEMESTVYQEYTETSHYQNPSGVRAVCADCHVPHHSWIATMMRKARASMNELPNHFLGKLDTPEKFEAHRLEMAESVWAEMKANDSQECRSCHKREAMLLGEQRTRAQKQHQAAREEGQTCIECHEGIAHKLPEGMEGDEEPEPEDFTF